MSLERITDRLQSNLAGFAGLGAKVAFDLGADGAVAVDATVSPPTLSTETQDAACTIRVSAKDLEGMMEGTVNPMLAYTLGRLKVEGSLGVAMKVAALLED